MCNNCNYYAEITTPYGVVAKCTITNNLLSELDKGSVKNCLAKRGVNMLNKQYLCKPLKQYLINLIEKVSGKGDSWDTVDVNADIMKIIEEAEQKLWTLLPTKPTKTGFYFVTYFKDGGEADVEYCYYKENGKFYMIAEGSEEANQSWEEELNTVIAWCEIPKRYNSKKKVQKNILGKYPMIKKRFTEVE